MAKTKITKSKLSDYHPELFKNKSAMAAPSKHAGKVKFRKVSRVADFTEKDFEKEHARVVARVKGLYSGLRSKAVPLSKGSDDDEGGEGRAETSQAMLTNIGKFERKYGEWNKKTGKEADGSEENPVLID